MKKSALLIILIAMISGWFLMFSVIIPKTMEIRIPEMKEYLKHEGYNNPQMVEIHGFGSTADFKDGDKKVTISFLHGVFRIVK